jgi:hypothetical protein
VNEHPLTQEEARQIAVDAFIYTYPLVLMELTRQQQTSGRPGGVGMNELAHLRQFPTAEFRSVVRPNFDTLYSFAWIDLTAGPVVVTTPDLTGRYHLLPFYDMWTDAFAVPGTRATGGVAASYALLPPEWEGTVSPDLVPIPAPTSVVWLVGRIQTNGAADYEAVHPLQDLLSAEPLDADSVAAAASPLLHGSPHIDATTPPPDALAAMDPGDYFALAAQLMAIHPPHPTDWSAAARLRRIGLTPGDEFHLESLEPTARAALVEAPAEALAHMRDSVLRLAPLVNGWQVNTQSMGVYGNDYLKRAVIALVGLGANPPEDAVYPLNFTDSEGRPVDGTHDYVLHFDAQALPPAQAFWSVTVYDGDGFPLDTPLGRYALGDRDPLVRNEDGSLDLFLQQESPGAEREPNWIPTKPGTLGVTMRIYGPAPDALDGRWEPPPIVRR